MHKYRRAYLEITNVCNKSCSFCPGTKRPAAWMSRDLFELAARQIKELADEVYLHVLGEPSLHPKLTAFLDYCEALKLAVKITSNGVTFPDAWRHPAITQINFSLHSFDWEHEQAALLALAKGIKTLAYLRPELYLNLRLWNLAEYQTMSATNLPLIQKISALFGQTDYVFLNRKSQCLAGRVYWNSDSVFDWPGEIAAAGELPETAGRCYGLVTQFAVLVDGTVTPCCLDSEGAIALGNVQNEPLSAILSSERAQKIRYGFEHNCVSETLCKKCTFRRRFQ